MDWLSSRRVAGRAEAEMLVDAATQNPPGLDMRIVMPNVVVYLSQTGLTAQSTLNAGFGNLRNVLLFAVKVTLATRAWFLCFVMCWSERGQF
jgi:hypothetical protein